MSHRIMKALFISTPHYLFQVSLIALVVALSVSAVINDEVDYTLEVDSKLNVEGVEYSVADLDENGVVLTSGKNKLQLRVNQPIRFRKFSVFLTSYYEELNGDFFFEPWGIEYSGELNRVIESDQVRIIISDAYVDKNGQWAGVKVRIIEAGNTIEDKMYAIGKSNDYGMVSDLYLEGHGIVHVAENKLYGVIYFLIGLSIVSGLLWIRKEFEKGERS